MSSPAELRLAWASHKAAAFACTRWHYSRSVPAGKLVKVGVWEDGAFIGCVLFGRGANNNIGSKYGLEQTGVCELVRIALTAHRTPVSRIMAIALRMLKANSPGLRLVVSYADPDQGHHGGVYQATNWIYAGRSKPQRELIIGGKVVHKRSANSLYGTSVPARVTQISGMAAAYGREQWKHTYLMPLDAEMRDQITRLQKPYPKRA